MFRSDRLNNIILIYIIRKYHILKVCAQNKINKNEYETIMCSNYKTKFYQETIANHKTNSIMRQKILFLYNVKSINKISFVNIEILCKVQLLKGRSK